MQIIVETKNDCVERVKVEYTPVEWLIAKTALELMEENPNINIKDVRRIKEMLNSKPEIKEQMQRLIVINEDDLIAITRIGLSRVPEAVLKRIDTAIQNGTPLPKRHGRLIDADNLHHKMSEWLKPPKSDESEMVDLADIAISTMIEIEEADTIIEADKGE